MVLLHKETMVHRAAQVMVHLHKEVAMARRAAATEVLRHKATMVLLRADTVHQVVVRRAAMVHHLRVIMAARAATQIVMVLWAMVLPEV